MAKKKEREIALAGIECAMERLKQCNRPSQPIDDFEIFAKFIATQLRSLKDPEYAKTTQRKLQRVLLQCMDDEPVNPNILSYSI